MARADFTQKTIAVIARRAAYLCNRPECRKLTVGQQRTINMMLVRFHLTPNWSCVLSLSSKKIYCRLWTQMPNMTDTFITSKENSNTVWAFTLRYVSSSPKSTSIGIPLDSQSLHTYNTRVIIRRSSHAKKINNHYR